MLLARHRAEKLQKDVDALNGIQAEYDELKSSNATQTEELSSLRSANDDMTKQIAALEEIRSEHEDLLGNIKKERRAHAEKLEAAEGDSVDGF